MRFTRANVAFALVIALAATASADPLEVRTTGGEPFSGEVAAISDSAISFESASGRRELPLEAIVACGRLRDCADGTHVLLADGSLLVASDVRLEDETLIVQSNLFGEAEGFAIAGTSRLPLGAVRGAVFRVPPEPLARDLLAGRVASAKGNGDQLWLANGDVLRGTIVALGSAGTEDRPGPPTVNITTEAGELEISPDKPDGRLLEKITAVVFNPLLIRLASTDDLRAVIGFRDGSRLVATRVEAKDGGHVVFTLACGAKITSNPDANIWDAINFVQPLGGKVRYLTDLTSAADSYKHTPLLDLTWPLGVDENVLGGRLRSGGAMFLRGLGMHASSRVGYALDRPYRRLEAELALDDSAGSRGSVVFRATTDADGGKVVYQSPIIRGGQKPLAVSIDLAGAKRLVLDVTAADRGTEMDRANWLNLRLVE